MRFEVEGEAMGVSAYLESLRGADRPGRRDSGGRQVAFALGGLAGGNAFGAGFLTAAQQAGVHPSAITCTSGMIVWTAHYLAGHDLRETLREMLAAMPRAPEGAPAFSNQWLLAKGLPGVFRPATSEYWERWASLSPLAAPKQWMDLLLPAQTWVPTRSEEFFGFVAETLSAAPIPVMFNAFCPPTGQEVLFLNAAACDQLGVEWDSQTPTLRYLPISAEGVAAALHLYSYGYERTYFGLNLIDGAYHRQFILNELCELKPASRPAVLWVVRPQNSRWIGPMPSNYFEQREMETELGMNSSYSMQIARITLINQLLREGRLRGDDRTPIQVEPFQYVGKRGYFDYFIESEEVFDMAYHRALDQFHIHLSRQHS